MKITKRVVGSVHPTFIQSRAKAALQEMFNRRCPMWHNGWDGFLRRAEIKRQDRIRRALRALSDVMWDVVESGATSSDVASCLINGGHYPHELKTILPSFEQLEDAAFVAAERAYEQRIGA